MFSKLALKNVTRSLRDYSIYFLTLMFGVCIFYVFNSLDSQWVMESLRGADAPAQTRATMDSILMLVDIFSVFVSVILAFLILYANNFMVKRRKKELGIYMLLGLSQGRISSIFLLETLLIGLFSLAAGLALGVLLSQFFSVFTAGLFQITVTQFHFVFSMPAVGKTVLYFGVIFLVVMVFNSLSVSRKKLIDLLQEGRKNEDLKLKSLTVSAVLFLLSLALLGIAYAMLLHRGILRIDTLFFVMLALGSLGTLFFFRALSGFLLRLFQSNKRLYYRGLNMFTLRQFAARVGSNYVSMTVICLMLLLAIGITACSVGMNNVLDSRVNAQAPYDFYVAAARIDPEDPQKDIPVDVPAALKQVGFDPEVQLSEGAWVDEWSGNVELPERGERVVVHMISLSSYNSLCRLGGRAQLALEPDCYGWAIPAGETLPAQLETWPVISVEGHALRVGESAVLRASAVCSDYRPAQDRMNAYLIIPDQVLPDGEVGEHIYRVSHHYCGNYRTDLAKETTETLLQECMDRFSHAALGDGGGWIYFQTKLEVYMEVMGTKIMVLFLGIYLGIVFLLCSAAVLALQQLSQAADNVPRYRILSRLGAEERMRDRSVYVQVLLAFLLPLALALVHAVVGMTAANRAIAQVGRLDVTASSAVTAVFIVLFYGAYLLATCWGSRRIARGR